MTSPSRETTVCYRHPDRPTRLACTSCGRPICVDCSYDAAVGQRCPECAAPEGRHTVISARSIRRVSRESTPVTWALIAINLGLFLVGRIDTDVGSRLFIEGAQHPVLIEGGEWYRVFTAMFLHDGLVHVGFNSYALYLFGPALERRFGSASFASLYLAAGLGGGALYHAVGRQVFAIGASGAVFGLMAALIAATFRQRHTPAGRAVFSQLMLLLAINLALPAIVPNIAWEAHLGGLVAGLLISAAWDRLPHERPGAVTGRVAVAVGVAVAALVAVLLG